MSMPVKLFVSNLHHTVSDDELMELFSEFGNVIEATVHYNRFGYPFGMGHVIFQNAQDATAAYESYHNFNLYGYPLTITWMPQRAPETCLQGRLSVRASKSNGQKKPLKRLAYVSKKVGSQRYLNNISHLNKGKVKSRIRLTAIQLDIELEEYIKGRKDQSVSRKIEHVNETSVDSSVYSPVSEVESVTREKLCFDENFNEVENFCENFSLLIKRSGSESGESQKTPQDQGLNSNLQDASTSINKTKSLMNTGRPSDSQTEKLTGNSDGKNRKKNVDSEDFEKVAHGVDVSGGLMENVPPLVKKERLSVVGVNESHEDEMNEEAAVFEDASNISYELFEAKNDPHEKCAENSKKDPEDSTSISYMRDAFWACDDNKALEFSTGESCLETPENIGREFRIKRKIDLENDDIMPVQKPEGDNITPSLKENSDDDQMFMKPPNMKKKSQTRQSVRNAPKKKVGFS